MNDNEIQMPTTDDLAQQFMHMLEILELAETGHQPSIDECLFFFRQSIVHGASMLDDPNIKIAVKDLVERETGKTVIENTTNG